ncbi:hypothetical protein QTP88_005735 [Uroleucon formosanum]
MSTLFAAEHTATTNTTRPPHQSTCFSAAARRRRPPAKHPPTLRLPLPLHYIMDIYMDIFFANNLGPSWANILQHRAYSIYAFNEESLECNILQTRHTWVIRLPIGYNARPCRPAYSIRGRTLDSLLKIRVVDCFPTAHMFVLNLQVTRTEKRTKFHPLFGEGCYSCDDFFLCQT